MSRNKYQNVVENICVPTGLEERVLAAARRQGTENKRMAKGWFRPAARIAVCAMCALTLVLGSVRLRTPAAPADAAPEGGNVESVRREEGPQVFPLSLSFGLTAYAADTGDAFPAREDGAIAFSAGEGMINPGEGDFTGCLFQVTGEDIASVSLSIDRGGLYRYRLLENLTEEELAYYREHMGTPELATASISQTDDGVWYMPEMSALGSSVQEDYDPDTRYGFWVAPEDMAWNTGLGISAEAQRDADYFDGAVLTVTAVFENGGEHTQTYRLHSGNLKVEWTEDNVLTVLPELAGDDDLWVYGIYAVPEE
ncbi:hypothetical protein [Oscillibacter sp. 1-3]|uniref:hypothetical protein n=1 Tax=Oscillibacter sp. 1-3 TaxID=1235797 RepID=UPI00033A9B84|nr:hypothetical protein [Oscillibacter sp. 1-3]EOS66406.1 hypothetical protein C816_01454 [Oscillibacter sp. 1-3]